VAPAEDADTTAVHAYDCLCHTVSTIFSQEISQDIMVKIVELDKPHQMITGLSQ